MVICNSDFKNDMDAARGVVEDRLAELFARKPDTQVAQAAQYAVTGAGHRWRALIAMAAGRIFSPNALAVVLPSACAIELAHAASLVLDDLPSMDDAELRRGQPCVHRVYPAWVVDMVPVYLVTLAYESCLDNPLTSHARSNEAAVLLSRAGLDMIAGQEIDLTNAAAGDEQVLLECYANKSAALFAAAAAGGAIVCGATAPEVAMLRDCGRAIGLAYQLKDDVADATAHVEQLGKNGRMDINKHTAIDGLGVEGTLVRIQKWRRDALDAIECFDEAAGGLRQLIARLEVTLPHY